MLKELLGAAASLKQSSTKVSNQLIDSQNEIEQLRSSLEQITQESQKDFLTGAFNRKTLDSKLAEKIAAARELKNSLCLVMVDIDHFKTIQRQVWPFNWR